MSKKLNLVNQNQSNDKTAKAVVGETRLRRGKAKDTATQSHAHVEDYTRRLEIGKAKAAQKAADYKIMCDRLDRAYDTYAKHMADAFGEGVRTMMRNTATVNGNDYDAAAAKEREFVAAANGREVARALHMADEYTVSAAAADSTVKVAKKTAKKSTAAKKTAAPVAPVANDDLAALEALRDSGILSDYMFKKLSAKIAESATTSVKAAKSENTTTAPRRNYNGGRRANKRKVEMTNVHNVTGKDGIVYTVGTFTRTDNGETNYAVWMEEYKAEGTTFLKSLGFKWSGYAQAFITKENPDNALTGKSAKKSAKSAKKTA